VRIGGAHDLLLAVGEKGAGGAPSRPSSSVGIPRSHDVDLIHRDHVASEHHRLEVQPAIAVQQARETGEEPPEDPAARLNAVAEELASQVVEHGPELRAQLRLSLESNGGDRPELPFRIGRAIAWIEEALATLRWQLPEPELRRLVLAIRCAVGIEALVWLTDIAGISREEAVDLMRWSAQALLRSTLSDQAATESSAA